MYLPARSVACAIYKLIRVLGQRCSSRRYLSVHHLRIAAFRNIAGKMAYWCTGKTNDELIRNLAKFKIITQERIDEAFKKVDRANYVLEKESAYRDSPQQIRCNATISAPHMHAHAAENLLPFLQPGARVLDVGSGSGYTLALFHHLVGPSGKVIGIDHMSELTAWSEENLRADGLGSALNAGQIEIICGDGREGVSKGAPYDAIHVGAAPPKLPKALVAQLKAPGRMFIPIGTGHQQIIQVDKDEAGNVTQKALLDVMYVPLTDQKTQLERE